MHYFCTIFIHNIDGYLTLVNNKNNNNTNDNENNYYDYS